ncbi:hypothetical protein AVO45_14585 [Ruegeria marisrubri]|uniref:Uncharacterized protein n=1 Tax=Ruegeria marisrubri TaxID=1685379 RepID=A0A0X3TC00_9RHOB|nr:hypothetical protein [Ruegeria marisrubri]KUJ73314.1 hypothetical protein AVO45_14585 [Ruegeria marisrubri]
MGSNIDPADQIIVTISGDTTRFVTGNPPNDATGDLDATVGLPGFNWTPGLQLWEISTGPTLGTASINLLTGTWTYTVDPAESLFLGEEALHIMSSEGLRELAEIFSVRNDLDGEGFGTAARTILKAYEATILA